MGVLALYSIYQSGFTRESEVDDVSPYYNHFLRFIHMDASVIQKYLHSHPMSQSQSRILLLQFRSGKREGVRTEIKIPPITEDSQAFEKGISVS